MKRLNKDFPGCNIILGVQSQFGWGKWHWMNAGPQLRLPSIAERCFDFVEDSVAQQVEAQQCQQRDKTVGQQLAAADLAGTRAFLTAMHQEG